MKKHYETHVEDTDKLIYEKVAKNINTYELTPSEALQVKDRYPEYVETI